MALVRSIIDYLRREHGYRRTRTSLHDLDDRILEDIGIRRDQIDTLAFRLRENERKYAAAEAQNRKNEKARHRTLGGSGLAPQH